MNWNKKLLESVLGDEILELEAGSLPRFGSVPDPDLSDQEKKLVGEAAAMALLNIEVEFGMGPRSDLRQGLIKVANDLAMVDEPGSDIVGAMRFSLGEHYGEDIPVYVYRVAVHCLHASIARIFKRELEAIKTVVPIAS